MAFNPSYQGVRRHSRAHTTFSGYQLHDSGYGGHSKDQPVGLLSAGKQFYSNGPTSSSSTQQPQSGFTYQSPHTIHGNAGPNVQPGTNVSINTTGSPAITGYTSAAKSTFTNNTASRRSSIAGLTHRSRAASLPPRTASLQARQSYPLSTHFNGDIVAEAVDHALGEIVHDTVEDLFKPPPPRSGIDGTAHYMNVPLYDLVRSYAILRLCTVVGSYPQVIEKSTDLFTKWAPGIVQDVIFGLFVKPTFFGHFCGGANLDETFRRSRASLKKDGLGMILEYSVESDMTSTCANEVDKAADAVKDQISRAIAAAHAERRTQPKARRFESPVNSAAAAPDAGLDDAMLAIKLTALCPPAVLYRVSESYEKIMEGYDQLFQKLRRTPTVGEALGELSWLNWFACEVKSVAQIVPNVRSGARAWMPPESTPLHIGTLLKHTGSRLERVDMDHIFTCYLTHFPSSSLRAAPSPLSIFTGDDQVAFTKMLGRVGKLCQEADCQVPMLVDAEQTYFQPAITLTTMLLSSYFNKQYPTLWNTQQMYLKRGVPEVERYVETAQRQGWIPALKIVRGAYMVSERARAAKLDIPSPIHETLQDTHDAYNRALQFLLVNQPADPYVMVASHNEESLKYASGLLRQGLSLSTRVGFAQLKGMCDSVTVDLAKQGLKTYKWVPYGPVRDAIPYLVRRIQENSTLLSSPAAQEDLRQMQEAVKLRLTGSRHRMVTA